MAQAKELMGDGSHAPHFVRAFRFSEIAALLLEDVAKKNGDTESIKSPSEIRNEWLGLELNVIDAVTSSNPVIIACNQGMENAKTLEVTKASIENAYGDTYLFEDAANFATSQCSIGSSEADALASSNL